MNRFIINGYWKDDNAPFEGYIIDEAEESRDDENVFFNGLSENDIRREIKLGKETDLEFVMVTIYQFTPNFLRARE